MKPSLNFCLTWKRDEVVKHLSPLFNALGAGRAGTRNLGVGAGGSLFFSPWSLLRGNRHTVLSAPYFLESCFCSLWVAMRWSIVLIPLFAALATVFGSSLWHLKRET